jgi:hypothetical protein
VADPKTKRFLLQTKCRSRFVVAAISHLEAGCLVPRLIPGAALCHAHQTKHLAVCDHAEQNRLMRDG